MKVYLADAYANFRKPLVAMLEHDGHEVASTHDGNALLAMIVECAPDVVIADLRLDGISGLELLVEMRNAGVLVPFVVMTTEPPGDVAQIVVGLGVVRVLQKPFRFDVLEKVLAELVS